MITRSGYKFEVTSKIKDTWIPYHKSIAMIHLSNWGAIFLYSGTRVPIENEEFLTECVNAWLPIKKEQEFKKYKNFLKQQEKGQQMALEVKRRRIEEIKRRQAEDQRERERTRRASDSDSYYGSTDSDLQTFYSVSGASWM